MFRKSNNTANVGVVISLPYSPFRHFNLTGLAVEDTSL